MVGLAGCDTVLSARCGSSENNSYSVEATVLLTGEVAGLFAESYSALYSDRMGMGELGREWTFNEEYLLAVLYSTVPVAELEPFIPELPLSGLPPHALHRSRSRSPPPVLCSDGRRSAQACIWKGSMSRSNVELCTVLESPSITWGR